MRSAISFASFSAVPRSYFAEFAYPKRGNPQRTPYAAAFFILLSNISHAKHISQIPTGFISLSRKGQKNPPQVFPGRCCWSHIYLIRKRCASRRMISSSSSEQSQRTLRGRLKSRQNISIKLLPLILLRSSRMVTV